MARKQRPEDQPMTTKQTIQVVARQAGEARAVGDMKFVNSAHIVINALLDEEDEKKKR